MPLDPFFQIIQNYTNSVVGKILTHVEKNVAHFVKNRLIEYQVEEAKHCEELVSILYKEPVRLTDIYFPVAISRHDKEYSVSADKVSELFKSANKISLFGTAGSGKTTFVKYLFAKSVQDNYKIPILIYLRNLQISPSSPKENFDSNSLMTKISQSFSFHEIASDKSIADTLLSSGSFLFILDGFDELQARDHSRAIEDILDFTKRYSKNKYIITSRHYSGLENVTGFSSFSLCELTTNDIKPFIKKQLFRNESKANEIIKVINDSESNMFMPYLANPLFLILFINAFDTYPNLPKLTSKFYWQVFDALYEKHDNLSKTGFRRERKSKVSREMFETILNEFCWISYMNSNFEFDESYFTSTISRIKKHRKLDFDSRDFLTEVKNDLCLIVTNGLQLQFIHRSIQEYFAAKSIESFSEEDMAKLFSHIAISQSRRAQHTFLLKLLSEIFPKEYLKYFIPEYVKAFFEKHEDIFLDRVHQMGQLKAYLSDFLVFRLLINYSEQGKSIFAILHPTYGNTYHASLFNKEVVKELAKSFNMLPLAIEEIIMESLTAHKSRQNFKEKIQEYIKTESERNFGLINLIFRGKEV